MANINNELEYINSMAANAPVELIEKSEERYKNIIDDISRRVCEDKGRDACGSLFLGQNHHRQKTVRSVFAKRSQDLCAQP